MNLEYNNSKVRQYAIYREFINSIFSFIIILILLNAATSPALSQPSSPITITDIQGRSVTLPHHAKRLLVDDGRYLIALSLMVDDPVALIAAWPHDVHRLGDAAYETYRQKFPAIADKARIAGSAEALSVEQVLDVAPDIAIFREGMGPNSEQIRQIEAAGIPVVFIDFFSQPLENLEKSLRILGHIIGAEERTEAFIAFRNAHLKRITDRIAATPDLVRPKVFLEAHAGLTECCNSPGRGNVGNYITLAGGHNIGADVLPGAFGKLGIEYIISSEPEIYIATGGPQTAKAGGFVIGPGFSPEQSRTSLAKMAARPGIAALDPVTRGEVHGLAHQLLNSPFDILVAERLAKWIHPALFADVDPDKTIEELNTRFLAVPLAGPNWIDLR